MLNTSINNSALDNITHKMLSECHVRYRGMARLQVILRHFGEDCLMISSAKLIPVVLGGIATLEILETEVGLA